MGIVFIIVLCFVFLLGVFLYIDTVFCEKCGKKVDTVGDYYYCDCGVRKNKKIKK